MTDELDRRVDRAVGLPSHEPVHSLVDQKLEVENKRINDVIREGGVPTARDLAVLDRLARIKALRTAAALRRAGRIAYLAIVGVCAVVLLTLFMCRASSTNIEVDVRLTKLSFELPNGKRQLVPGEWGEVVQLASASVTGIDTVDPPEDVPPSAVQFSMLAMQTNELAPVARAVKLQRFEFPDAKVKLTARVAYGAGQRGLELGTESDKAVTASFAHTRAIPDDATPAKSSLVLQPVKVTGKQLHTTLYPLEPTRPLTVVRNAGGMDVKTFDFSEGARSTVLSGTLTVEGRRSGVETLMPGDDVTLTGDDVFLRELTYQDDAIHMRMSIQATSAEVGHKLRNIMPTWFDEIVSRWSNELYSTAIAAIGLALAILRWWKS